MDSNSVWLKVQCEIWNFKEIKKKSNKLILNKMKVNYEHSENEHNLAYYNFIRDGN